MNFYALSALASAAATLILIMIVLIYGRRKTAALSYTLWGLSIAIWNLGLFTLYNARDMQEAYRYLDFLMIGTLFIFPTTFNMIVELTGNRSRFNNILAYAGYALSLVFLFLHFKLHILSNRLMHFSWGYYPVADIGDHLYAAVCLSYISYSQVLIYRKMAASVGHKLNQYRFIFWGTTIGYAVGVTNFLPPFGIDVYPLGNVSTIVFTSAVAYVLLTVKLTNLHYLFRKVALETLTLLTVALMCAVFVHPAASYLMGRISDGVLFALIIACALVFMLVFYERLRNKYFSFFFEYHQVFRRDIQAWSKQIQGILTKKDLFEEVIKMVIKMFMVEKSLIRVSDKDDAKTGDKVLMEYADNHGEILLRDELERKVDLGKPVSDQERHLLEDLQMRGFSALVPFRTGIGMSGYLLVGAKLSGNMFDQDEIDALVMIKDSVESSLKNIENLGIIKTQESKIEHELQKANKLESLGILAGGIAHDFNNLLTIIVGNISLLKNSLRGDAEASEILAEAEKSAKKAIGLSGQLSTFAQGGSPHKQVISIAGHLRDLTVFASRGSKAKCSFDIQEGLWLVEVDDSQFSQVVNNIVINAAQAMPFGGKLEVSAANRHISSGGNPLKPSGRFVVVTFKDHGVGIPEENLGKIFDPYFTTKETGTGLGLAIVYSIMKKHGGYVEFESKVGLGTTFRLYFPACEEQGVDLKEDPKKKAQQGSGKVLVMDDDPSIQAMLRRMLSSLGYETVNCGSGVEAIEHVKSAKAGGKPFNLAVMDLTVQGGLGGKAAVTMIKGIDPEIKAVVSSGYSDDDVMSDPAKYNFDGRISKPYTIEEISAVLGKLLKDGKRLN